MSNRVDAFPIPIHSTLSCNFFGWCEVVKILEKKREPKGPNGPPSFFLTPRKVKYQSRMVFFRLSILFFQYRLCDNNALEVWTFVLFTKETACEHENVQLWKKMLSLVSSHDQYWESKRKRSFYAADQLLLIILIILVFILLRARKKLVQEGSNYLFGKSLLLKPLAAFKAVADEKTLWQTY